MTNHAAFSSSASAPSTSPGSGPLGWERLSRPTLSHRASDDGCLPVHQHRPPQYHESSVAHPPRSSRRLSLSPYPCSSSSSSHSPLPSPHTRKPAPSRSRVNKSGYTRSRTGCYTCRQQKKKCDEFRPECSRCRNNGHACEYPNERHAVGAATGVDNYFYPPQQVSAAQEFGRALGESQRRVNTDRRSWILPPLSPRPRVSYERAWHSPELARPRKTAPAVSLPPIESFDRIHLARPSFF